MEIDSNGIIIKRLCAEDAKAVSILEKACFSHPWPLDVVAAELKRENYLCAGVFLAEELIAYSANCLVLDELQILKIAVKESERQKGIAHRLVLFVFEEAVARGARVAHLEVRSSNAPAKKLYQRLGFDIVGERKGYYQDSNEDAVLMSLELIPSEIDKLKV